MWMHQRANNTLGHEDGVELQALPPTQKVGNDSMRPTRSGRSEGSRGCVLTTADLPAIRHDSETLEHEKGQIEAGRTVSDYDMTATVSIDSAQHSTVNHFELSILIAQEV
jgi:hypothetical protein